MCARFRVREIPEEGKVALLTTLRRLGLALALRNKRHFWSSLFPAFSVLLVHDFFNCIIQSRKLLVRGVLTGYWAGLSPELWARAENPKLNMVKTGCEGDLTSVNF